VIVMLRSWGEKWLEDGKSPAIGLTHKSCGGAMTPTLVCSTCGEPVGARDSRVHLSERMRLERNEHRGSSH